MSMFDPVMLSPLLLIILIFLTYLNVMESQKGKDIRNKLDKLADTLDKLAEKLDK